MHVHCFCNDVLYPCYYRNFLRLGNPLCCSLNSITLDEISPGQQDGDQSEEPTSTATSAEVNVDPNTPDSKIEENSSNTNELAETASSNQSEDDPQLSQNEEAPYGGSLSLARIQSLVSMTTPRDGGQPGLMGQVPPFVEFDLSIDGFGCLFLPSLFPQGIDQACTVQCYRNLLHVHTSVHNLCTYILYGFFAYHIVLYIIVHC